MSSLPSTPATSVIVVSYRPGPWLEPCLRSVLDQAGEVILVDNGSAGAEASAIAAQVGARVIRCKRNLGFAPAVNLALRSARGDLVGLLNDDAEAGPDWLAAAAEVLADPRVAAVTPKVLLSGRYAEWVVPDVTGADAPTLRQVTAGGLDVTARLVGPGLAPIHLGLDPDALAKPRPLVAGRPLYIPLPDPDPGLDADADAEAGSGVLIDGVPVATGPVVRLVNHAGSFLLRHGIAGEHGYGAPDDGRFDRRRDCFGFSATAPVLSARALRRVGPLAGAFFAYNEDTDWCLRARAAGWRVVYDPTSTARHRLSATSGGPANARVRHLSERNALLCLLRNAPRPVVGECVVPRLRRGPRDAVRQDVLRLLPWALATRAAMAPRRRIGPGRLWAEWAGRDASWDDTPARPTGHDLC